MAAPALSREQSINAVAARLGELKQSIQRLRAPGVLCRIDYDIDGPEITPEYPTTVPHDEDLTCALEEEGQRIYDDAIRAGLKPGAWDDHAWIQLRQGASGLEYAGVDVELGRLLKERKR